MVRSPSGSKQRASKLPFEMRSLVNLRELYLAGNGFLEEPPEVRELRKRSQKLVVVELGVPDYILRALAERAAAAEAVALAKKRAHVDGMTAALSSTHHPASLNSTRSSMWPSQ